MMLRREDLPRDPDLLADIVMRQAAELEKMHVALKIANGTAFGARSERRAVLPGQGDLDLGDLNREVTPPPAANDEAAAVKTQSKPRSRRAKRNRGFLPKHLPRVETVIEPASLNCGCGCRLHKVGEDVAEALDVIPAILRVLRTVRPRYACRACEDGIVQAPAPARLCEGSMASSALIVWVAVSRYAWHLPISRQTKMLAGHGITLDRSTLCRWVKRLAWWVEPLYRRQLAVMHTAERLYCDETRMPVRRKGKRKVHTGQFWSHATDDSSWNGPAPRAVIHVYAEGRGHKEIKAQLSDYQGWVQVDGYAGYNGLLQKDRTPGPIRLAFCLAHSRRKFVDVYKAIRSPFAGEIIERMAAIYAIEAEIRGSSAVHRQNIRQIRTAPLMAELKAALERGLGLASRKSALAKAIRYSLGRWAGLTLFLGDGRLDVDTNVVERNIRPVALGRKNSLYAGDDGGAHTWAVLASLAQTAILNDVDPQIYLLDVAERLVSGEVKITDLDRLLVWNWKAEREAQKLQVAA